VHREQIEWVEAVWARFRGDYAGCRVVDLGAGDVNGSSRHLFAGCDYLGVDVAAGPNVDIVSPAHLAPIEAASAGVVICTEMLEHDPHWEASLAAMRRMLKPGGLLILTCAAIGRPEHGTLAATPEDSLATAAGLDGYREWYRTPHGSEIVQHLGEPWFVRYCLDRIDEPHDLRYWGIRSEAADA
jgi:SAM-dependent methyltransferase